ncbi:MAG: type II toxin-antitoxin system RelE/ParE family toxin [Acutalibacteraceae bacterium]
MGEKQRYKVIVSDRAKQMLGAHIRFLAQVNKEAAAEKKKQIMTALRSLTQMPQRFPFVDEEYLNLSKYHKMYIGKWYIVLYQIMDDAVYVEYILDCRKDYTWLIR